MRPLPPLNSNLKSKQLQVNDSPDNCQIPVACFFLKHRVSVHLFLLQFWNSFFFLILLFIVERWRKYCWLSCRNFLKKKPVSFPFKILKIAGLMGASLDPLPILPTHEFILCYTPGTWHVSVITVIRYVLHLQRDGKRLRYNKHMTR